MPWRRQRGHKEMRRAYRSASDQLPGRAAAPRTAIVYGMAQGAGGSVQDPNGKVEIGECVQSQDNAKRCVLEISMAARAGVMFPDWLY